MASRYLSIWFRHLKTDWFARKNPDLAEKTFVLAAPTHGKMVITSATECALAFGIYPGMAVADARAILPRLVVLDDEPGIEIKLLENIARWCIRFSPVVSADLPAGILIDCTGCTHLWNGEEKYLEEILKKLGAFGYQGKGAIAETIGTAWAVARYSKSAAIIDPGKQTDVLMALPPSALRIDPLVAGRLEKLGLTRIEHFISMPRNALRRRFGENILVQMDKAVGTKEEAVIPIIPLQPYISRLPAPEPIVTAKGIEIGVEFLLDDLCNQLRKEQKGLRSAFLRCFRVDGKILSIHVGTSLATSNTTHLYKLFGIKLSSIEPAAGIELFMMEATAVEAVSAEQELMWAGNSGLDDTALCRLIDNIINKTNGVIINKFLPAEHHWPERSFIKAASLQEEPACEWNNQKSRPVKMLTKPELIGVSAPVPDYPPMLFRYKGAVHQVKKADGPERIEREWWLETGEHRDYYSVEDQDGMRYWIFRSGHYDSEKKDQWFIHGFFC